MFENIALTGFADEIAASLDTQMQVLEKLHMNYIEMRGVDGRNFVEYSAAEAKEIRKRLEDRGFALSAVGSPIGKIGITEDFAPHMELFKHTVELAHIMETPNIRMFSFYVPKENAAVYKGQVMERLGQFVDYAAAGGIVLLHENEKDIYGDTVKRCEDLMRELNCRHFRAVFDPANFVQCGQDTKEACEKLKDFVSYVHIKDAFMKDGSVVSAGSGDGNVEYILKSLFDAGYDGFLSLEPHLGSFAGLAALELDDKMLDLPQGGEGTFTLAYRALEEIIDKIK